MRQRRWIELFSDYDCEIRYHPGKANVVADALNRKERVKPRRVRAMSMTIQSSIKDKMLAAQYEASKEENAPAEILRGLDQQMEEKEDGGLYFMDRIWVPLIGDVRTMIMDEAHAMRYSIHPGSNKMYYDLSDMYWWSGMKRDIAKYVIVVEVEGWVRYNLDEIVARHGVPVSIISDRDGRFSSRFWQSLQKALGTWLDMSTAYHPRTDRQSERTIQTLKDMLRAEIEGSQLIGPELVQETTNKVVLIKERLKAAGDRQKSYDDNRL
ncbi:putative reverse transcriptase domain-containing protein [Tanacetum coccineum]